jgi:hypothetical protein
VSTPAPARPSLLAAFSPFSPPAAEERPPAQAPATAPAVHRFSGSGIRFPPPAHVSFKVGRGGGGAGGGGCRESARWLHAAHARG